MSLVIDDGHINAVQSYISEQCEAIEDITSRYVRTMETVIETGIMEGATAEAVKAFLVAVESYVANNSATPARMISQTERFCVNFISKVDKADKHLY